MKKIAVVLFNLGGPDTKKSIRPFLFNFFMDRNIVDAPLPVRFALAQYISITRSRKEAGTSYGFLGGKSPLLENSTAQAQALETTLNAGRLSEYKAFVCMRYWHPMAADVVKQVKEWGAEEVILLPLYPQFSTTTTWSSLGQWRLESQKQNLKISESVVCCYPFNEGFIKASAENIRAAMMEAKIDGHAAPRVLFSAHGLPEKIIKGGDPYQWQCEQSAAKIASVLGISDWQVCYQSRVGRLQWIGPSTEDALAQAARDKKAVVVYPHAFTQEHVETLVEIEIEYREKAHKMGISGFYRAGTVATHPAFIKGLASLVVGASNGVAAEGGACICPPQFGRCCMSAYQANSDLSSASIA
jgi:ferrochelatase